jgi:protein-tyrosine-phosphatase
MSKNDLPLSILFCCDHNAIRSPIAEGLMKKKFGTLIYVQSVGVESEREIDGFAITVCKEIDVELSRHQVRNFDEMEALGDHMEEFDIVVALSRASHIKVMKLVNNKNLKIEYWPIIDPIFNSERREEKLIVYRAIRDQLDTLIFDRFNEK